jgi:lon-related putative ATP-dependent protease
MVNRLDARQLRYTCDPSSFPFESTAELEPLDRIIGQGRAIEALKLGLGIKDAKNRYNIYVAGDPGTGKMSAVELFLSQASADEAQPPDLCYVHNFQNPYSPQSLELPAGRGCQLRGDLEQLIKRLKREIPSVFESDEFKSRSKKIAERYNQKRSSLLESMETKARELGFSIQRTPIGINTLPLDTSGEPLSQEEYAALSEEEQNSIRQRQSEVQTVIQERMQDVARLDEDREGEIKQLAREAVLFMVEPHFGALRSNHEGLPKVLSFLDGVKTDIIENIEAFRNGGNQARKMPMPMPFAMPQADPFKKYTVNVLVDHAKTKGAPVVVEQNATYPNLFGSIDRRVQMGVAVTDFTMIKAGSLHRANGGYLVLNANNLFRLGISWEALKIALKRGEIHIEDPWQMLGYSTAEGLRPEPVPFRMKLVIIGSPYIYELLYQYDEDFQKLFSVKADFGMEMERSPENEQAMARFLGTCCRQDPNVLPFSPSGVAQMVEHAAELAGDQSKLSCQFGSLASVVKEASFWAREHGSERVESDDVQLALDQRDHRHNRIDEKIQEMIEQGTIIVDTEGSRAGQVNGLAVLQLGNYAFGKPSRITASVFAGKGGIVDIEREAKLGGKTHTKGIMLLKGYLGQKLSKERPLSFAASVAFEQSYSMIDGDSASSTELYALLSALADVPIRQGLAVTGSVNQMGEVQAIGGVNEKIEGFYRVCKAKGLTGEQGVLIPVANIKNLMLHREVVRAVEAGEFHIYAVSTVEEGIEQLTGVEAGSPNAEGVYPEDSVFGRVIQRLEAMEKAMKASEKDEGNHETKPVDEDA